MKKTNEVVLTNEQERLLDYARSMGFEGIADILENMFKDPKVYESMSFEAKVMACLEREAEYISTAQFNRLFKRSNLRHKFYINDFKPNPDRGYEVNTLRLLSECNYIAKGANIIITGPTGCGKTALAEAAGVEAISRGNTVMFTSGADLAEKLQEMGSDSFLRFKNRMKSINLLIIDDWGLEKMSDTAIARLKGIADVRYGKWATIFTTQVKKQGIVSMIDESPIRDAIEDRWFRSAIEIGLKGDSCRGTIEEMK